MAAGVVNIWSGHGDNRQLIATTPMTPLGVSAPSTQDPPMTAPTPPAIVACSTTSSPGGIWAPHNSPTHTRAPSRVAGVLLGLEINRVLGSLEANADDSPGRYNTELLSPAKNSSANSHETHPQKLLKYTSPGPDTEEPTTPKNQVMAPSKATTSPLSPKTVSRLLPRAKNSPKLRPISPPFKRPTAPTPGSEYSISPESQKALTLPLVLSRTPASPSPPPVFTRTPSPSSGNIANFGSGPEGLYTPSVGHATSRTQLAATLRFDEDVFGPILASHEWGNHGPPVFTRHSPQSRSLTRITQNAWEHTPEAAAVQTGGEAEVSYDSQEDTTLNEFCAPDDEGDSTNINGHHSSDDEVSSIIATDSVASCHTCDSSQGWSSGSSDWFESYDRRSRHGAPGPPVLRPGTTIAVATVNTEAIDLAGASADSSLDWSAATIPHPEEDSVIHSLDGITCPSEGELTLDSSQQSIHESDEGLDEPVCVVTNSLGSVFNEGPMLPPRQLSDVSTPTPRPPPRRRSTPVKKSSLSNIMHGVYENARTLKQDPHGPGTPGFSANGGSPPNTPTSKNTPSPARKPDGSLATPPPFRLGQGRVRESPPKPTAPIGSGRPGSSEASQQQLWDAPSTNRTYCSNGTSNPTLGSRLEPCERFAPHTDGGESSHANARSTLLGGNEDRHTTPPCTLRTSRISTSNANGRPLHWEIPTQTCPGFSSAGSREAEESGLQRTVASHPSDPSPGGRYWQTELVIPSIVVTPPDDISGDSSHECKSQRSVSPPLTLEPAPSSSVQIDYLSPTYRPSRFKGKGKSLAVTPPLSKVTDLPYRLVRQKGEIDPSELQSPLQKLISTVAGQLDHIDEHGFVDPHAPMLVPLSPPAPTSRTPHGLRMRMRTPPERLWDIEEGSETEHAVEYDWRHEYAQEKISVPLDRDYETTNETASSKDTLRARIWAGAQNDSGSESDSSDDVARSKLIRESKLRDGVVRIRPGAESRMGLDTFKFPKHEDNTQRENSVQDEIPIPLTPRLGCIQLPSSASSQNLPSGNEGREGFVRSEPEPEASTIQPATLPPIPARTGGRSLHRRTQSTPTSNQATAPATLEQTAHRRSFSIYEWRLRLDPGERNPSIGMVVETMASFTTSLSRTGSGSLHRRAKSTPAAMPVTVTDESSGTSVSGSIHVPEEELQSETSMSHGPEATVSEVCPETEMVPAQAEVSDRASSQEAATPPSQESTSDSSAATVQEMEGESPEPSLTPSPQSSSVWSLNKPLPPLPPAAEHGRRGLRQRFRAWTATHVAQGFGAQASVYANPGHAGNTGQYGMPGSTPAATQNATEMVDHLHHSITAQSHVGNGTQNARAQDDSVVNGGAHNTWRGSRHKKTRSTGSSFKLSFGI
ncbi:hypothetical protein CC85DRAFT_318528 [Cutaneotrichosporon oleaginosum]|uniref:Uncharacterized protein n=1 Tax=Cutaneotrichosporon oleaginosum TaxID=879819 RepID=A0A0J0XMX3_9TREE|nr:uncharacterized protein CC85DRAFT_318528 [Cutaneotrichosporon oleaginosum]KLT42455.1 hypothetical protein CC85DRAFT_318528 [Cutaneotrichosporon oleaginosum]TXT06974.1 hypothetical protein COLE_06305 [Cutaneotrichosporon oleaginosum]